MTEPRIPTMPCPNCGGNGWFVCASLYPCDARHDCAECRRTGIVPHPPLTAAEVAALPDGARVVVEDTHPPCLRRGRITCADDRAAAERLVRGGVRVWLTDDAEL